MGKRPLIIHHIDSRIISWHWFILGYVYPTAQKSFDSYTTKSPALSFQQQSNAPFVYASGQSKLPAQDQPGYITDQTTNPFYDYDQYVFNGEGRQGNSDYRDEGQASQDKGNEGQGVNGYGSGGQEEQAYGYPGMVFILDGCSFHVAHVWCKQGLLPKKKSDLMTLSM